MSFAFPTDHEDVGNTSVVCRLSLEVLSFPLRVSAAVVTRTAQASAARGEYPLAYRADSFDPSTAATGGSAGGGSAGGGGAAVAGGGGEESSSPAWAFSVSLRDCGEADFLVSERRYNQSVARAWRPKERVMMEWKEEDEEAGEEEGGAALKAYFGVVSKIAPERGQSETWPNSPWGCLTIQWDMDGSTNSLGPWEPRPVRQASIFCVVVSGFLRVGRLYMPIFVSAFVLFGPPPFFVVSVGCLWFFSLRVCVRRLWPFLRVLRSGCWVGVCTTGEYKYAAEQDRAHRREHDR